LSWRIDLAAGLFLLMASVAFAGDASQPDTTKGVSPSSRSPWMVGTGLSVEYRELAGVFVVHDGAPACFRAEGCDYLLMVPSSEMQGVPFANKAAAIVKGVVLVARRAGSTTQYRIWPWEYKVKLKTTVVPDSSLQVAGWVQDYLDGLTER